MNLETIDRQAAISAILHGSEFVCFCITCPGEPEKIEPDRLLARIFGTGGSKADWEKRAKMHGFSIHWWMEERAY